MAKRRNYQARMASPKCDLCVMPFTSRTPAFETFTLEDLRVPMTSIDPLSGNWVSTIFPKSQGWGVCRECRDLVDDYGAALEEAMMIRFVRHRAALEGRSARDLDPIVLGVVILVARVLARAARTPWVTNWDHQAGLQQIWIEGDE
jgi:hypothetical protein